MFFAPMDSNWVSALIALAAVLISLVSAFANEIFPFRLSLRADEVIFAPPSAPSHDSPALILPLVFINEGNGSGVVEALSMKIENNGVSKIYTPIAEIDFGRYLTGKRKLHAENMLGTFSSFTLGSKESVKKHILFSQEEHSTKYPFSKWSEGQHTFRVYVKSSRAKKPVELATITYSINKQVLDEYKNGVGSSLAGSRELDI